MPSRLEGKPLEYTNISSAERTESRPPKRVQEILKITNLDQSTHACHEKHTHTEVATLGGGCFWCTEAVFGEINGVIKVEPGYSGGKSRNPTYKQVCAGTTGHAEVVQLTFAPDVISFRELLEIFFAMHDPTTLNRQGADIGTQYRSVVFYHDSRQKATTEKYIEELHAAQVYDAPIVTQIEPFECFFRAEEYHQDYFIRHPEQPYCKLTIAPKIIKARTQYRNKFKD